MQICFCNNYFGMCMLYFPLYSVIVKTGTRRYSLRVREQREICLFFFWVMLNFWSCVQRHTETYQDPSNQAGTRYCSTSLCSGGLVGSWSIFIAPLVNLLYSECWAALYTDTFSPQLAKCHTGPGAVPIETPSYWIYYLHAVHYRRLKTDALPWGTCWYAELTSSDGYFCAADLEKQIQSLLAE